MRLLREIGIDVIGTHVQTYSDGASPIRGVTVDAYTAQLDKFMVQSGPTGIEATNFAGRLFVSGGTVASFGGPVIGPQVRIEWQGTIDQKQAIVRFWDTPIRPYGNVTIDKFSELAVPATSDAADWPIDYMGNWIRRFQIFACGGDIVRASAQLTVAGVTPTNKTVVIPDTSAAQIGIFDAPWPIQSAVVTIRNQGAAPFDVFGGLQAQLND